MTVIPDTNEVRKFLTLSYREMVKANGKTTFKNLKADMFGTCIAGGGLPALSAFQGFWRSLQLNLEAKGHAVTVKDTRPMVLPDPNLQQAIVGLRPWQKGWILKALMTGNSGLIGAPTRFGKSFGMSALCKAYPDATTVIVAPGVGLCKQLFDHFREILPYREIRGVYTGSKHRNQGPQGSITICSMDSLEKMDPDDTDLLIIDEPHAVVSDERLPKLAAFAKTRKYGFGATLTGRFDKKDRLIEGLIGPILSNVTYREAVTQGAISPLKVILVKIPFSKDTIPGGRVERETVYKRLLTQSSRTAKLVKQFVDDVIPQDWQTMAFIRDEKQAEFYMEHAFPPHGTIAMAKRMTPKRRDGVTDRIAAGELVRVLASNIYVQGITFPDLKVVINLAGGGANTTAIQKPGRLLQTRPNKNYGVMIDFIFECKDAELDNRQPAPYQGIIGESWARHAAYVDIGYDVIFVDKLEQAVAIVKGAYEYETVEEEA
jgi:superfamily II DNA or RNA helicase